MSNLPLISAHNVSKRYAGPANLDVIDRLDLEVAPREIVVIIGRSGSGKSTLLNLIGQMEQADSGRIMVEGQDTASWDDAARTAFRATRLGFVFQSFNLLPSLNVRENVALPLELARRADDARVEKLLGRLGIGHLGTRFPDQISGGEQQRAAIARALVHAPALIIADEPTGNLDRESGHIVVDLFESCVREAGAALLMATHSPDMVGHADRIFDLKDGRLARVRQ